MREVVSYYPVRNIKTIRVTCNHTGCGAVVELPIQSAEAVMQKTGGCCPVCGRPLKSPTVEGGADLVGGLAKVVIALNALASQVQIELPITEEI